MGEVSLIAIFTFQLCNDRFKSIQSTFQVFYDFLSQHIGSGRLSKSASDSSFSQVISKDVLSLASISSSLLCAGPKKGTTLKRVTILLIPGNKCGPMWLFPVWLLLEFRLIVTLRFF
jgi:hypothetical protein